jgi:hypothetical protein
MGQVVKYSLKLIWYDTGRSYKRRPGDLPEEVVKTFLTTANIVEKSIQTLGIPFFEIATS